MGYDGRHLHLPVPVAATLHLPLIGNAETLVINGVAHKPDEFELCPIGRV